MSKIREKPPEKARAWDSLKADVQFCVHAIAQEYAESRWYRFMSATFNRTNKLSNTILGGSIVSVTIIFIYDNREFLLHNKRWVAITILSALTVFLMWVALTVRRFHERIIGDLNTKQQSDVKTLKGREKEKRFKLFHLYRKRLAFMNEHLKPTVSIEYFADRPGFIANKQIRNKHYRVLRVRVTNEGGEPLYSLRAQLRLINHNFSYSDIDLTLKEQDLPIIQRILYRHETQALPASSSSFSLSRGERQFVNVAMQENENGKWSGVTLCLSHIGADNYSNDIYPQEPIEFSIIVLGGIYPPYSKRFVLFLDENRVLHLKEAD